jgi:hypothetical protein
MVSFGPYDVIDVRLRAADTVIFLDLRLLRCAWRAIGRSWQRADFWRWLVAYRWKSRPLLAQKIREHAATADVHIFRTPGAVRRFVDGQETTNSQGTSKDNRPRARRYSWPTRRCSNDRRDPLIRNETAGWLRVRHEATHHSLTVS